MRLLPTSSAPDGATLARDILTGRDAAPLLRAGMAINQRYRDALKRAGIHAIYIDDEFSAGILPEPLVSDEVRLEATRAVATAYEQARAALSTGRPLGKATSDTLGAIVERILRDIEQSGGTALVLADLACADAYTFQHSIDVTALGLLIGHRLFREHGWRDYRGVRQHARRDERLSRLGMGLLLHDIGKLTVPNEILHKPGKLTPEEWEIMRTHPRAGVELLRDTSAWCPLVQAVVLRHHERFDGGGYPDGKSGDQIHEMARIAAVADVYDAVTSARSYAPAAPPHAGVRAILDGAGTHFDPTITEVFALLVAPFPPGAELELSDGRRGVVASVPEGQLDRPVVRVLDGSGVTWEIALADAPEIRIAGWHQVPAAVAA
jgi:HD-GYP domain-containing protein (c-di-GMP phosphodiesterase class II)